MAEKRMTCARCPRYDHDARRCRDGKANPKKKADTVEVAEILGVTALCYHNPFRDPLALRMYFPNARATIAASARVVRSHRPGKVTVEIEETE